MFHCLRVNQFYSFVLFFWQNQVCYYDNESRSVHHMQDTQYFDNHTILATT